MSESSLSIKTLNEEMTIQSLEDTILSDGTESNLSSKAPESCQKLCILDIDSYILNLSSNKDLNVECQSLCSKCDESICSEKSSTCRVSSENEEYQGKEDCGSAKESCWKNSFLRFRLQYLLVHMAIMLADGLQGEFYVSFLKNHCYTVLITNVGLKILVQEPTFMFSMKVTVTLLHHFIHWDLWLVLLPLHSLGLS